MVDIVKLKKDGRAPSSSPGWADFSIMMECTPESGHCESSVYNVLGFDYGQKQCISLTIYSLQHNPIPPSPDPPVIR